MQIVPRKPTGRNRLLTPREHTGELLYANLTFVVRGGPIVAWSGNSPKFPGNFPVFCLKDRAFA
jgi:hypothetical protein